MRDLIIIISVTYIGPSIILQLSYDNNSIGYTSVDSHPHTRLGQYPFILEIAWMRRHIVILWFASNQVVFDSNYCLQHCLKEPVLAQGVDSQVVLSLDTISRPLGHIALEDHEVWKVVAEVYNDYLPLFSEESARKHPSHRPGVEHEIQLDPEFKPTFGPLYPLSQNELKAQKEWTDDMLDKGFIRPSSIPAAASMLFVKKKEGSLRPCLDYRGLNKGTVKDRYPLPLINKTLTRIAKAKIITKIDIREAYNLIRIKEGDEWKTAFRTRFGLFEFLVMPFRLTNAPATFQRYINNTLRPYLDLFCTAYLEDVIIYCDTQEEHNEHVQLVLELLTGAGLHAKPQKCEFGKTSTKYLRVLIAPNGIEMDPKKSQPFGIGLFPVD